MTTVACVLRSGGVYDPDWVYRLERQVARHLFRYRFVCLTDMAVEGLDTIPLQHGWPGWWSKMELFRPGQFDGRVLYFDLDTLITGDITPLSHYNGDFAALRDFMRPDTYASGVMAWSAGALDHLYCEMVRDPPPLRGRSDFWWNEQVEQVEAIQELHNGLVGSYKVDGLEDGPGDYSVVCFHGTPKQCDLEGTWVERAWIA